MYTYILHMYKSFHEYQIFANTLRIFANNVRLHTKTKFEYREYIRVNVHRFYFEYIREYREYVQQNLFIFTLLYKWKWVKETKNKNWMQLVPILLKAF